MGFKALDIQCPIVKRLLQFLNLPTMNETACFPKPSSLLVITLFQKVAIAGQAQNGLHSKISPAIQSNRITQVLPFFKHHKRDRYPDHSYTFKKSSFLPLPVSFMHYRCPGAPNSAPLAPIPPRYLSLPSVKLTVTAAQPSPVAWCAVCDHLATCLLDREASKEKLR